MLTFNMSYFLGLFPRLSTALPFTMEVIAASILLCLCTGTLVAVIRIAKVPFLHQSARCGCPTTGPCLSFWTCTWCTSCCR